MILVEMKACGWYYSPQTLLRVEQIDGDDLTAPRRTGSQISGARISSASKKPSILSGTTAITGFDSIGRLEDRSVQ